MIISSSPPSSHPPPSSSSKWKHLLNASISQYPLQKQKKLFFSSCAEHWGIREVYCCSTRLNRTKGAYFCLASSFLGPSNALIVSKWQQLCDELTQSLVSPLLLFPPEHSNTKDAQPAPPAALFFCLSFVTLQVCLSLHASVHKHLQLLLF